ncbi:MAG: hypothetical protein JNM63_15095, partial [Spirochaetia bacterium]|nr:hypothetical protein [Spirochaetia bacterium]
PKPMEGISHCAAKVPSPKGEIAASWKKSGNEFHISLKVPAGVAAKIEAPGFKAKIVGPKKFQHTCKV